MTILEAIILGILQGLTEFLPISSSGHLVIGQILLGVQQPGNEFEILVHIGTLASIIIVFFDDIRSIIYSLNTKNTQNFIFFILVGSIPAALIGFALKDTFDLLFENIIAVGFALITTGILLIASTFTKKDKKAYSFFSSFLIGCAQAIAIIPGISRSGITISMALFLGLSSKDAARFSFLIAIPIIIGAGLLETIESGGSFELPFSIVLGAFFTSFIFGVFALKWLLGILENGKFYYFGIYCIIVGFTVTIMSY